MLVLDRKVNEAIVIRFLQEDFIVRVLETGRSRVSLGFEGRREIRISRMEQLPEYAKYVEDLKHVTWVDAATSPPREGLILPSSSSQTS